MRSLTEIQLLRFLLEIAALLIASRALAELMKRADQASVIGELLAGILLGESVLGHLAPSVFAFMFTADPLASRLLESFAWFGAIMLLLYIGLETDLQVLRSIGRTATIVSGCGIVIPFASGIVLGYLLPPHYLANPNARLIFALFMAVAMSISAVPVIAKILIDLGLMRRELGLLILGAGIVDDTTGWLMLSIVAGLATRGSLDVLSVAILLGETLAFLTFCYFVGYRLVSRFLRWADDHMFVDHAKFGAIVIVTLVSAVAAQAIGLHAVFGAFVAGLMVRSSTRLRPSDVEDLRAITLGVMAPTFFAFSGLRADLLTLANPIVPIAVLAVACIGKLVGCGVGGLLAGLKTREASAVAIGMNARGGMGIIVALLGLSLGVLTQEMYTVIIMIAIVTSLMAPPLLKWSLSTVEVTPTEEERIEREGLLAHLPVAEGAKLLVLSGGGPNADLAAHIAAAMAGHRDASITVFRALAPGLPDFTEQFNAQFERIKAIAEGFGAKNVLQRTGSGETITDAIVDEMGRGYDAIFTGASVFEGRPTLGGEILRELVAHARAPVVIVRDAGTPVPFKRILVPITGAAFSRLGASMAMQYAQTFQGALTTLYVRERAPLSLAAFRLKQSPTDEGEEFVEEIRRIGREVGVEVEAQVGSGRRPENVILSSAQNGNYDLLMMGVLFRSSEQRLYFGPKVRQILGRVTCSVALVVPPQQGVRT